jgi:biofilm PGA synthesis N-glycosyltransferase PgaC
MLAQWYHWLCSTRIHELLLMFVGLLLLDGPRYTLSRAVVLTCDVACDLLRWLRGTPPPEFDHCPSLSVIVAGYNEAETITATLESIHGTYPRLEIIVVDDGSQDGMAAVARAFARRHEGILVLSRPERGGKSSAMNYALCYATGEIVVSLDADSSLGPNALWEIVQPFRDPQVGVVSASVLPRNPWHGLVTWMQAYEYMHSIVVGRHVSHCFGVLAIASGAFAAMRREAMERTGAWDVGPPEDFDVTLRILRCGYRIAFTRHAQCLTDLPTTWWGLIKQRLRWDQGAVVRNYLRKHAGMLCFWRSNCPPRVFFIALEGILFQFLCPIAFLIYSIYVALTYQHSLLNLVIALYLCALVVEVAQVVVLFYYSDDLRRDAQICLVFPLMPLYQLLLLVVRLVSNFQELIYRASFHDNYVPRHVREVTWKW